jgi:hypothetical protein
VRAAKRSPIQRYERNRTKHLTTHNALGTCNGETTEAALSRPYTLLFRLFTSSDSKKTVQALKLSTCVELHVPKSSATSKEQKG